MVDVAAQNTAPLPSLLVVDDDRLVLATLVQGLTPQGWQVWAADSVGEALDLLADGLRPDLALLDVRLPDGDGVTLARRLHDEHQTPFVMLSAYSDEATVRQASAQGALGYLVKPVDPAQLAPMLQTALERARERHRLAEQNTQLQTALETNREINVAVGIAMMQYRLSREAAFELLRQAARSQRRKLSELAREVIENSEQLHEHASKRKT